MRVARNGCGIVLVYGMQCEVNMEALPPDVDGSGQLAAYPACLVGHDIGSKVASVYMMHDKKQQIHILPHTQVCKCMMPLPDEESAIGTEVEIQTRVSETDEYGWWGAIVLNYSSVLRQYHIRWLNTQLDVTVDKVYVRRASFVTKKK